MRPADGSGPWLADVGFGSHSDYPLRLDATDDPAGRFRLAGASDGDIDVLRDGAPQSHFTWSTICSRRTSAGRVSISGRILIQTQNGTRTEQQIDTDDALLAAYRDHFGVVLSRVPDDPAAEPKT